MTKLNKNPMFNRSYQPPIEFLHKLTESKARPAIVPSYPKPKLKNKNEIDIAEML